MSAEDVNTLLDFDHKSEDDGIKRDQWDRYVIPDPETGEIRSWTRVSTIKDQLEDKKQLHDWKMRNVVLGIGRREDLFALAASVAGSADTEDKKTLNEVIARAEEAGGGNVKSTLGTSMHGFTQRLDLGEKNLKVPSQWKDDIDAYLQAMKTFGIWPHERYVEKYVIIPEIDAAGQFDRLLMGDGWELPRIGDLKTGSVTKRGRGFAMQLAMYAHATHIYDPKTKTFTPMPPVDQKTAVLIHLPIGRGECTFYEIDIEAGWEDAQAAYVEHKRRKKKDYARPLVKWEEAPAEEPKPKKARKAPAKKKAEPTSTRDELIEKAKRGEPMTKKSSKPAEVEVEWCDICSCDVPCSFAEKHAAEHAKAAEPDPEALFTERLAYALERVKYVVTNGGGADLGDVWANSCGDIPTFKNGGPRNNEEIGRVLGACSVVEMTHQMQFPPFTDPSKAKQQDNDINEKAITA